MKKINLHLISDSTGETVSSIARAVMSLFEGIDAEENIWSLTRTKGQIDKVLEEIKENPGIVMYTIIDPLLQDYLAEGCKKINVPYVAPLNRVISEMSSLLGMGIKMRAGSQYELDEEYFSRVEAINFSISHDDGQATWDLEEADIILVGVSRTSKSPTSMYLSHRGYKAANVPMVKGVALPETLFSLTKPLIVGLVIAPERLIEIRKSRLLSMKEDRDTSYVDMDSIKEELVEAKKLFSKQRWPVIDVTRKSVEEVAANIIQLHQQRRKKEERE